MAIRVLLSGYGQMGKILEELVVEAADLELASIVDADNVDDFEAGTFGPVDVVIDFSGPGMFPHLAKFVESTGAALVCGTTGFADPNAEVRPLGEYAPVVYAANYSRGVNAVKHLVAQAGQVLADWDAELVEIHHNHKADAPSGTANLLVSQLLDADHRKHQYGRVGAQAKRESGEIGIHALRGGTIPGEHTVYFFGPDEVVEIRHRAYSRRIFALGAIAAARALVAKPKGCYAFDDLMQN